MNHISSGTTSDKPKRDWSYTLDKFLNPYFKRHRKYMAAIKVAASESDTFSFCASAFHATNWSYDLHHDLGRIVAITPMRDSWVSMLSESATPASYGVDVLVEVEPLESKEVLVGISTQSIRGGCMTLGFASWDERWHNEAKAVAEKYLSVLITIFDRQGINYGDFIELDPEDLK